MIQKDRKLPSVVARLVPRELKSKEKGVVEAFDVLGAECLVSDQICAGLEEMSRHLKWIGDDFRTDQIDRVEARARSIVMLADQMGLRRVGQVAADVVYCVDTPDRTALAATLSRLIRLLEQALDSAVGPAPAS